MGYNSESYKRVREAYRSKYLVAYNEAERRMAEVHAKSPELADIDRQLLSTSAQLALAVLGTGDEYQKRLAEVKAKNQALQQRREELLQSLGYPADYTLPPYECSKCRDSGYVDTKMCDCMRRELILAAYEESGLGELMRTQSFENFDLSYYDEASGDRARMKRNVEILQQYAESFDAGADNLLFCGGTGLGKTHLSTSLARRVIERGFDVYYTPAINMFADFSEARFGQSVERAAADPVRYTGCDLLIIDDLGTETTNQFTVSCLYSVINNRMNLKRPTIINTNLSGKELQARYTDRITSRIFGEYKPLLFAGTDVRRQKLAKNTNKP